MIKKIKEYFEYKKNCKVVKMTAAKILSTSLPVVMEFTEKSSSVMSFILKLSEASKNVATEDLYHMVISEVANLLNTSESRLVEIVTYMATLSPQDMQKILVHSTVESNAKLNKTE